MTITKSEIFDNDVLTMVAHLTRQECFDLQFALWHLTTDTRIDKGTRVRTFALWDSFMKSRNFQSLVALSYDDNETNE